MIVLALLELYLRHGDELLTMKSNVIVQLHQLLSLKNDLNDDQTNKNLPSPSVSAHIGTHWTLDAVWPWKPS